MTKSGIEKKLPISMFSKEFSGINYKIIFKFSSFKNKIKMNDEILINENKIITKYQENLLKSYGIKHEDDLFELIGLIKSYNKVERKGCFFIIQSKKYGNIEVRKWQPNIILDGVIVTLKSYKTQ